MPFMLRCSVRLSVCEFHVFALSLGVGVVSLANGVEDDEAVDDEAVRSI